MLERSGKRWGMKRMLGSFAVAFALAGSIGALAAQARTLDVNRPSEEQIRDAVATIDLSKQIAYATKPVTSGSYVPGKLSDQTQADALRTLNVVRYIAGISNDVTLSDDYIEKAQAAALENYAEGGMNHYPDTKPAGMDDALFQKAQEGAGNGNLHWESGSSMSMNAAIVSGWMADNNSADNLNTVGHRRWCLNPTMKMAGFGAVTGSKGSFACMYAHDKNGSSSYDTVVWPAQTMPTEYFEGSYPWSISSNTAFSSSTKVTLTRERNGQTDTWNFSGSSSDGHFAINNQNFGTPGCVIFRPSKVGSYQDGDLFTVNVTDGTDTLEYQVKFFSLVKTPEKAKITLKYNVRGVKVKEDVYNTIECTDSSITNDKISIIVDDESLVETELVGDTLWITGVKEGTTDITVSLPNGSSAKCTVKVVGQDHEHSYTLTKIVREPTCYLEGVEVRNLCECGATSSSSYYSIDKLSHELVETAGEDATCTNPGLSKGSVCKVCGYVEQEQTEIPALGHDWIKDEAIEPTCTEPGREAGQHCSRCGETEGRDEIAALGHDWIEDEAKEPTCTEPGREAGQHCSRCGETEGCKEIEPLGHAPVEDVAKDPTCTETGLTEGLHCSRCEEILKPQEEVEALGHDYEVVEEAVKATCETPGHTEELQCSRCGDIVLQETIDALGHDWIKDEAIEPTCMEPGREAGQHCSRCGETEGRDEIAALGHEWIEDEAKEPTCTEPGREAGQHCSRCGETEGCKEIEALGHEPVEDAAKDPTCTETGLTEGSHCSRCEEILKPQEEVEALGHDFEYDESTAEPATCTEPGLTALGKCSRCDEIDEQKTIEPLGHEIVIDKEVPATCTEDGLTEGKHCTRCEYAIKQETIDKLGHNWVEAEAVAPTYEMDGRTAGVYCTRCEEVYEGMEVIPKLVRPVPQSPAVGVTVNDMKSGGTYTVSVAGPAGTAAVTFKTPANKNAASVTVPDVVVLNNVACKVTAIAPNAFKNNKKLKNVKIGANIVTIGANAFSGCKKLANVTFSAGVTTIETKAFFKCTGLKKVTIPASVTKIGKQAFNGCAKLKTIVIKSTKLTAKNVGSKAFAKISKKAKVKVPKKCLKTYKKLLRKKGLPASVKVKK